MRNQIEVAGERKEERRGEERVKWEDEGVKKMRRGEKRKR